MLQSIQRRAFYSKASFSSFGITHASHVTSCSKCPNLDSFRRPTRFLRFQYPLVQSQSDLCYLPLSALVAHEYDFAPPFFFLSSCLPPSSPSLLPPPPPPSPLPPSPPTRQDVRCLPKPRLPVPATSRRLLRPPFLRDLRDLLLKEVFSIRERPPSTPRPGSGPLRASLEGILKGVQPGKLNVISAGMEGGRRGAKKREQGRRGRREGGEGEGYEAMINNLF